MKFTLSGAKLIRVDKEKLIMHVWFGGDTVYAYKLLGTQVDTNTVKNFPHPTYTQIKQFIKELINQNKKGVK